MTKRLAEALEHLSPDQIAQVTQYVESFAGVKSPPGVESPSEAKMSWVGALRGGPYASGLEAQEAAKHYRLFLLERGMSR